MGNKISNKIGIPVLIILIVIGWFQYRKYIESKEEVIMAPVLKEDERAKYTVQDKKVTKITRRKNKDGTVEQVRETIEGARKVAITIKEDGSINVYARSHGPIFEPGVAIGYSGDKPRIGVDAQLYYWRRFAVGTGVTIDMEEWRQVRINGTFHYTLPVKKLNNTSLFVGIDNKLDLAFGVRIKF